MTTPSPSPASHTPADIQARYREIDAQIAATRAKHPVRSALYSFALRQMFRLQPETIHVLMMKALSVVQRQPRLLRLMDRYWAVNDPVLKQDVFGVVFPRPLGLAAGFDKNVVAPDVWGPLGFGYAELGTITAQEQPGNPAPRLYRLPNDKAILNRMGFNNIGAEAAAERLAYHDHRNVVGINIGKSKVTEPDFAVEDYRTSASYLGHLADYLVINVSSPNTPGLRDLQAVESLRPIITAVKQETEIGNTSILVKIAPDLSDEDILAVADLALELEIDGIVCTNTTISREGLLTDADQVAAMGAGGISGRPESERALEVLRLLRAHVGNRLVLISVGGIETPQQAWERIGAGATLLQGYTPFIYGGPDWIRDIHRGLAAQVRAHGLSHISEAVGAELEWKPVK